MWDRHRALKPGDEGGVIVWVSFAARFDFSEDLGVLVDAFDSELLLTFLADALGDLSNNPTDLDLLGVGVHMSGHPLAILSTPKLNCEMIRSPRMTLYLGLGVSHSLGVVNSGTNANVVTVVFSGDISSNTLDEVLFVFIFWNFAKPVTIDANAGALSVCVTSGGSLGPTHGGRFSRSRSRSRSWRAGLTSTSCWRVLESYRPGPTYARLCWSRTNCLRSIGAGIC